MTAESWFAALAVFLSMLSWTRINPAGATGLAYLAAILVTALFHARYVRTQREFLVRPHPWLDFLLASLAEWITCCLTALYIARRVERPSYWELFVIPFSVALLTRYVLRKELLLDIRGLRRLHREHEID